MNDTQKKLLSGSLKSAVGAATGVVLTNCVDVPQPILSWLWFKHILIGIFFVVFITEARYWNQWANSGDTKGPTP